MSITQGDNVEVIHVTGLDDAKDTLRSVLADTDLGGNTLSDPNNTIVYVRTRDILDQLPPRPFKEACSNRRIRYFQSSVNITGRQIIIDIRKNMVNHRAVKIVIGASPVPLADVASAIEKGMKGLPKSLNVKFLFRVQEITTSHHVDHIMTLTFKDLKGEHDPFYREVKWHRDEGVSQEDVDAFVADMHHILRSWTNGYLKTRLTEITREKLDKTLDHMRHASMTHKNSIHLDRPIAIKSLIPKRGTNEWRVITSWDALDHYGNVIDSEVKHEIFLSIDGRTNVTINRAQIESKLKRNQNLEKVVKAKGLRISGPTMCMAREKRELADALKDFIAQKPSKGWARADKHVLSVKRGLITIEGPISANASVSNDAIVLTQRLPEAVESNLVGKSLSQIVDSASWSDQTIRKVEGHNTSTTISLAKQEIAAEEALEELKCLGSAAPLPQPGHSHPAPA